MRRFIPAEANQDRWSRRLAGLCRNALASAISAFAEVILRIWSASWRKDTEQILQLGRLLADGAPVLAMFWHGKYFPLFALAEGLSATIFVGQSFRGEVIARICRRFGFAVVLIPAHSRDGDAYEALLKGLGTAKLGVLAVDGPLGPHHEIKSGAVRLASELQLLIVPISVASDPKTILTWRWDKRELPHLFATVALSVGQPIRIPKGLDPKAMSEWSILIRNGLEAADAEAEERIRATRRYRKRRAV